MNNLKTAPFETVDIFDNIPGIKHGFFGRQGGVSTGNFDSLNFKASNGDTLENITQNKTIVAHSLGIKPSSIKTAHQVYGTDVVVVNEKTPTDPQPVADALVTNQPNLAIGVKTADCAPVLLACAETKVIGAIHGMWNCTFSGLIENTVKTMVKLGACRNAIHAAIGPCIAADHYEVDNPEFSKEHEWFYKKFIAQSADNHQFFSHYQENGLRHFDLRGYVAHKLRQSEIKTLSHCEIDTFSNPETLFSMRRNFKNNNKLFGAQISMIVNIQS